MEAMIRNRMASGSVLLSLLLLLLMVAHGSGAREINEKQSQLEDLIALDGDHDNFLRLPSMDAVKNHAMQERHDHDPNPSSSHMHHHAADPAVFTIFFTTKDLKAGHIMPIYIPKLKPSTSRRFLPRETAESIPFSSKQLPHLLRSFSFPEGSPRARQMEKTLVHCEAEPSVNGETKFCATSLESLLDSVQDILGVPHVRALTTTHLTESKTILQNYTIREKPQEIEVPRVIACHPIPYPYAVYFCHFIPETRVFKISLEGENGDRIEAMGTCHMNTTGWDPNHMAFQLLGVKPGFSEICHFFPANNLVWVPHVQV